MTRSQGEVYVMGEVPANVLQARELAVDVLRHVAAAEGGA